MKQIMKNLSVLLILAAAVLPARSEQVKTGKDMKSGLEYTVDMDGENIAVEYRFSGQMRLMQVIRNGFSLYINEEGKKLTDRGINIIGVQPKEKPQKPPQEGMSEDSAAEKRPSRPRFRQISGEFAAATWQNADQEPVALELGADKSGIIATFQGDSLDNVCRVLIPVRYINEKGLKAKNLMIGFVSKNSMKKTSERPAPSQQGDRRGGMPGARGDAPRERPAERQVGHQSNEIILWFKCK